MLFVAESFSQDVKRILAGVDRRFGMFANDSFDPPNLQPISTGACGNADR
ncbi:MAG: hypothetical protein Rhob2KO_20920 [Rhodopirellula baltica]